MAAIKDFSELLVQEPNNALGHTYRGRAFAKQGMYPEAVADLSAAIHLDPNNSVAFYHRGCLLRKAYPKQALQVWNDEMNTGVARISWGGGGGYRAKCV